eukprot:TRINITY_DN20111_c0_g1_i1.p1 TRINITY_DN20111_c0_g1~~TRINITY_DN20111_c0_g1_i1.p1  ORF type:complete len:155 (-),score=18.16 TRINITY_DN20111_c0_g1_i1:310-774(-)
MFHNVVRPERPREDNTEEKDILDLSAVEGTISMAFVKRILPFAIEGCFGVQSTKDRARRYLELAGGNPIEAVHSAIQNNNGWSRKLWDSVISSIPVVGVPHSTFKPTWRLLRELSLIAACFGLDVDSEETHNAILVAFYGLCQAEVCFLFSRHF